jgi:hypothetical protein
VSPSAEALPEDNSIPAAHIPHSLFTLDNSPESIKQRYAGIAVFPKFTYSKIDSTDNTSGATASFLSTMNVGVDLAWFQHWSDRFETNLHGGMLKESYETDSYNKTVSNMDHSLGNIGLGMKYTQFADFIFGVDVKQRDFIHAEALNVLSLDAVPIPQVSAGISIPVLDAYPFGLSLEGNYAYLFSSRGVSYTIQSGNAYDFGVTLSEILSPKMTLSGKFWYGQASESTSVESQVFKGTNVKIAVPYNPGISTAAPTISSISPTEGPILGGTNITVTGTNFVSGTTITFGGQQCTNLTVVSSTVITCTTPGHANGWVSVTVTAPDSTIALLTNAFDYLGTSNPHQDFGLASGGGVSTGPSMRLRGVAGVLTSQIQPTGLNVRMYPGLINMTVQH